MSHTLQFLLNKYGLLLTIPQIAEVIDLNSTSRPSAIRRANKFLERKARRAGLWR